MVLMGVWILLSFHSAWGTGISRRRETPTAAARHVKASTQGSVWCLVVDDWDRHDVVMMRSGIICQDEAQWSSWLQPRTGSEKRRSGVIVCRCMIGFHMP
ncbi:uncharacterized protein IWZ02DRAFT_52411 [Phyllosticta citriasiana]|uniref:uncharacterized protein n=1 Tax=Phyllosticta citriasiana TaxID=595635 RepID=UPI0030FD65B8